MTRNPIKRGLRLSLCLCTGCLARCPERAELAKKRGFGKYGSKKIPTPPGPK